MRLVQLVILVVTVSSPSYTKDVESNELALSTPPIKLDTNLRKALLKALTELENEENGKIANGEKTIEKASASSISFYANSDGSELNSNETTTTITTTTTTSKPTILFQRSEVSTERSFISFEKEDVDPINEAEQFLTSASSSFTSDSNKNEARSLSDTSKNSLIADNKPPKIQTTTPTTTTTSTEESEAKVEQVQFFSAPLVAAFTVHQDELGLPNKVEPIFKPVMTAKQKEELRKKEEEKKIKFHQEQEQLKQQFLREQEQIKQRHQLDLIEKQKRLEDEILRLRQQQRQQEALFKQQLLQQEQIRLRNSAQSFQTSFNGQFNQFSNFKPVLDEPTKTVLNQFVTERPTLNQQPSFTNFVTPTPIETQRNTFNLATGNNGISFQPSITFDPLVEAGKLPLNGQILPVKNAVDFHSPLIQTPTFQQFHSISNSFTPPFVNSFPQQFNPPVQQNRFLRQEQGVGNFGGNSGFTDNNIFKSGSNLNKQQFQGGNAIFRNNLDLPPSLQQSFQNVQQQQQQQQTRIFRSNSEESLNLRPPAPQNQLNNLLFNSGALRGKPQEDFNIISKVLSLNHLGNDGRFRYRNVPFVRK